MASPRLLARLISHLEHYLGDLGLLPAPAAPAPTPRALSASPLRRGAPQAASHPFSCGTSLLLLRWVSTTSCAAKCRFCSRTHPMPRSPPLSFGENMTMRTSIRAHHLHRDCGRAHRHLMRRCSTGTPSPRMRECRRRLAAGLAARPCEIQAPPSSPVGPAAPSTAKSRRCSCHGEACSVQCSAAAAG